MIEERQGNIVTAEVEALVNTVNIVGVMGKGVALQFKFAFPDMFKAYKKSCKANELKMGKMFVYKNPSLTGKVRFIINFPTKSHWRDKSNIDDIKEGLKSLIEVIKDNNIQSIAIPPLGCGMGGLNWSEVYPMIRETFDSLPHVNVIIYPPQSPLISQDLIVHTPKPELNWIRANIIRLLGKYSELDYKLTLLEIHKLLYFYQETGETQLKLRYVKRDFGPFAENLKHLLEKFEGHYTIGLSDGSNSPTKPITLTHNSVSEANTFIEGNKDFFSDSESKIQKVIQLIEGFETPYGLELLSTVHWVIKHDNVDSTDIKAIIDAVQSWSVRKRNIMTPNHINIALNVLKSNNWV